jgi:DNA transformation protein
MAVSTTFKDFVAEQLAGVGPIDIRRMFGGAGVFANGVMFALIVSDTLYFKTDEAGAKLFEAEGSAPFSYETSRGTHTLGSYWRVPERLFDEPDEIAAWAQRAVAVAIAGAKPKAHAPRKPKPRARRQRAR